LKRPQKPNRIVGVL